MTDPEHFHALPKGYRFEDYEIVRVLGHGGFGITYLGFDGNLDKPVAIKEYLPDGLAVRDATDSVVPKAASMVEDFEWGLDRFLDEAKTLARFRHSNLIQVFRFFRTNGTGYIVMEYAEGETLGELLERRDKLSKDELWAIMAPLLDGLETLHARQFMHRDIKPANIIIRDDGSPVLIDFGAARQAVGSKSQSFTAIVTAKYSPLEQYSPDGHQGPWTDIYAMGAVAYKALTGKLPPDPTERVGDDPYVPARELAAARAPVDFLGAIDWALALMAVERPRSVGEWRRALEGGEIKEKSAPKEAEKPPQAPEPMQAGPKSRKGLYWGLAVALLLAIGAVASYIYWPAPGAPGSGLPGSQPASLIEEAQGLLNRLGYEVGPPDGVMSARTEAAVRKFERDQSLIEVGEVDTLLIEKLKAELARRDEAAWQEALKAGTGEAIETYRKAWPKGVHAGEVDAEIARIKAAREEQAWAEAKQKNTIEGYEAYRKARPKGVHVGEAEAEIARLKAEQAEAAKRKAEEEDERAWAEAKRKQTIEGYEAYRRAYPRGKYVAEVDAEIAKLKAAAEARQKAESGAWRVAQSTDTAEAYRSYLMAHPSGAHAREARLKLTPYNLTWERTLGGPDSDAAISIVALADGDLAVAGYKGLVLIPTKGRALVLKLDRTGRLLWEKTFGGTSFDSANSIVALANGGFAIAGVRGGDAWISKLDSSGRALWDKTFGGSNTDAASSIVALADGGFAVVGWTDSKGAGKEDAWILRLDRTGRLLWDKTFGGSDSDIARSIVALVDGGFAVAGSNRSKGVGKSDVWVLRLDRTGGVLWEKTFGGFSWDEADSIVALADGGFAVAGRTESKGVGKRDAWILKIDRTGGVFWERTAGGVEDDYTHSIIALADGSFAVAGFTLSKGAGKEDAWIFRLDPPK